MESLCLGHSAPTTGRHVNYAEAMPTTPAWTPPPAPHQTAIDDVVIPALGEVPPGPAAHFLAGPGRLAPGFHALLAGYAHALRDEGIPVDRSMVVMPTLHPLMGALNFIWSGSNNVVREISRSWAANNTDEFKNSPVARLWSGTHRVIRRHLCDPAVENDFEIIDDLRQQGFTDYVITSIAPAGGHRVAALSWSTRTPGGFTDDNLRRLLSTVTFFAPLLDNLARVGQQPIDFGMAIHIGDVVYGNIGAPDRLDFTVIGPAVNLASRLQGQCRPLARPLLVSEAFVANCDEACLSLGEHHLPGVARAVKIFAPHSVR